MIKLLEPDEITAEILDEYNKSLSSSDRVNL